MRSTRFPDAPVDATPETRRAWGELTRILSQRLSDGAPFDDNSKIVNTSLVPVSTSINLLSYNLTATTDGLARLLLSLKKAGIIHVEEL